LGQEYKQKKSCGSPTLTWTLINGFIGVVNIIGSNVLAGELEMFGYLLEIRFVERQLAAFECVITQFNEMTKPLAPPRSRRDAHMRSNALRCDRKTTTKCQRRAPSGKSVWCFLEKNFTFIKFKKKKK